MVREREGAGYSLVPVVMVVILMVVAHAPRAAAETRVQTELETLLAAGWTGEEVGLTGVSRGTLDFRSPPRGNVQGRLQLRLTLTESTAGPGEQVEEGSTAGDDTDISLEVPRASVRFRFPLTEEYSLRITAGRDRLSWGLGSLFNAADLLFGADGRSTADFTRTADLRDETLWLLSFYVPLGALGYVETVTIPPPLERDETGAYTTASYRDLRTGLRLHSAAGPVSIEPAWLYDGKAGMHRLALSLQGTLGADIYGAVSVHRSDAGDTERDLTLLSAGALYMVRLARDHTLTLRMEALLQPDGAWSDRNERDAVYALQFHPELIWGAGAVTQIFARGLVSPLDYSGRILTGVAWNIFQGFYALVFTTTDVGSDRAVYGWDRPGSAALSLGFRYLF